MTTTLAPPSRSRIRSAGTLGPDPFAGTRTLLRLSVRRERIPLVSWILGITIAAVSTAAAFAELYPESADRVTFASSIGSNPALIVLAGTLPSSSIGGITMWRMGVLGGVLVSLMVIFTVIRRTRADEETGRTELVASTVVGRLAPLAAALIAALVPCVLIAVFVAAGVASQGESVSGSIAMGMAVAGPGLVFAAVAAVAAQLVETARSAMGLAGMVLAASFALRAVGDVSSAGWLTWISPLGWVEKVEAFGANNWWVLLLFPAAAVVGIAVAVRLLVRRDIGLALFPAGLGPAVGRLTSPLALAVRLQRGTLIGWAVGLAAMGAMIGSIVDSVGDIFGDNPEMLQILEQMGGKGALTETMLAAMASMIGLLVAVYAVSAALRPGAEESAVRAEPILAAAVSRNRWLAGHLLFVLLGPVVLLMVAGSALGIAHGAQAAEFGSAFSDGLLAAIAQLPAAWVMGGIAVLIFGVVPAARSAAWAVLAVLLLINMLGPTLQFPQWLLDLSPFSHVGTYPSGPLEWGSMGVLAVIAAVLTAIGVIGFSRRDLRTN